MQNEIKISNGYFQLWKAFLKKNQLDWKVLDLTLEQQVLLDEVLSQPIDQQSSYAFFMELICATRQYLDCPNFAFAMAKCISPAHFGLLGYMASRSENLAQALEYVIRFSRLVIDGAHVTQMQYVREGQTIRMFCPLSDAKYIFLHEVTLAAMLYLAKQFVPLDQFPLLQMSFVNVPQIPLKYYQEFYQCKLKFEQPLYEVIFSTEVLSLKPEQADPNLIQLLVKQAEATLLQRAQLTTVAQHLQFIIAEYIKLEQQAPKIEDIAQELHMSVRTLQRKLSQLETSFKVILEEERMKRCEYLLMQKLTLTNIALDLGYSDQSALARAYKAYSGQTLLQKKQQLK
ncbi:AraC family transcriptional regulator [Acinetobacter sp. ANC 4648]|uniref:AraC family transcriptional regulator n=1 Tax=Acinetobacter sp. ANC 4648 TaxID=1977875 RepID=UPI000A33BFFE|nr:AraC family transcriptional regulator [Acinetobacter sp. ANC 4648]OTG80023.1 AraC family transcriptional regulator [Acinetobacter sp. ANC 4648]